MSFMTVPFGYEAWYVPCQSVFWPGPAIDYAQSVSTYADATARVECRWDIRPGVDSFDTPLDMYKFDGVTSSTLTYVPLSRRIAFIDQIMFDIRLDAPNSSMLVNAQAYLAGQGLSNWSFGSERPATAKLVDRVQAIVGPFGTINYNLGSGDEPHDMSLSAVYDRPFKLDLTGTGDGVNIGFNAYPWEQISPSPSYAFVERTYTEFRHGLDDSAHLYGFWFIFTTGDIPPLRLNQRTDGLGFQAHPRQNQQNNAGHGASDNSGTRVKGYNTYV